MRKLFNVLIVFIAVFIIISAVTTAYNIVMHIIYPVRYYEYIDKYSKENGLDEYLVMAVIKAESNYIHDAHSGVAQGLMQITNETGLWISEKLDMDFTEKDLVDPETNIKMGCFYLSYLIDHYNKNTDVALAAYNAGMGNVAKWLKNGHYSSDGVNLSHIPFKETRDYVKKVNKYRETYRNLYDFHGSVASKVSGTKVDVNLIHS